MTKTGLVTMHDSPASSSGKAKAVSNAGVTSAPKGKSRRNMRSNSSNARETRAQDWNWADVLLTHPEKKPKKQKASQLLLPISILVCHSPHFLNKEIILHTELIDRAHHFLYRDTEVCGSFLRIFCHKLSHWNFLNVEKTKQLYYSRSLFIFPHISFRFLFKGVWL